MAQAEQELVFDNNTVDDLDKEQLKLLCKKWNLSCDERSAPQEKIKDFRRTAEKLVVDLRMRYGVEAPGDQSSTDDTNPDVQSVRSRSDRARIRGTRFVEMDLETDVSDETYGASSQSSGMVNVKFVHMQNCLSMYKTFLSEEDPDSVNSMYLREVVSDLEQSMNSLQVSENVSGRTD